MKPDISVMICTNVYDDYVDKALESIETQTHENIEILVVANGMSDFNFQKLKKRAIDRRIVLLHTHIAGVAFSRNLALHHCKAPLIAVMDADDISHPNRLAEQYQFMRENTHVVVCGSGYDTIDERDNVISTTQLPLDDRHIRRQLPWKNPICHPATVYRTTHIREIGGYAGNGAEDYDLWLRVAQNTAWHFQNLEIPLISYRIPIVSKARRSRKVYTHVATTQFQQFISSWNPKWIVATGATLLKKYVRSERD
ncbi:MAG TPA: glycosyl transferase [Pusillimonas sp.]|jgi:glycosyltransferase involved in cell wall biosynthesis|nr:glycosyl transferase [Pusillimonas sp.]|tara:strand:+ start:324418 stop:325179 length:762 start_codon:yes stop_codon:yes gene_type:complete